MTQGVYAVVEVKNGEVPRPYLEVLSEAHRLAHHTGTVATAIVVGSGADKASDVLGRYGASEALVLTHPQLSTYNLEAWASVMADVVAEKQ
ncbi:MAG: hypothetical protein ACYCW6_31985, partial [Candidatus Xenobia bacterium]